MSGSELDRMAGRAVVGKAWTAAALWRRAARCGAALAAGLVVVSCPDRSLSFSPTHLAQFCCLKPVMGLFGIGSRCVRPAPLGIVRCYHAVGSPLIVHAAAVHQQ